MPFGSSRRRCANRHYSHGRQSVVSPGKGWARSLGLPCHRCCARLSATGAPACPSCHTPRAASNSGHRSYGQYIGGRPIWGQAGRRSVGLQIGRIDHQAVSGLGWSRQLAEDLMEDPRSTQAHKPIAARLIRPIRVRGIPPLRPYRMTSMLPIISRRSATRGTPCDREQRDLDPVQLLHDQQTLLTHRHLQPECRTDHLLWEPANLLSPEPREGQGDPTGTPPSI